MKSLEEIENILIQYKPLLKDSFNVSDIGVFGSYTRREESQESDIDILVDFCGPIGWKFIDLKEFLEEILDRKVDLVTKNSLKPQIKNRILAEVIYV
jgi:hypothetical protein